MTQLKRENKPLNIMDAERIIGQSNSLSTVAVVTSESKEMPASMHWDQKPQSPQSYIPRFLQCSWRQNFWHIHTNCQTNITCHYCSGTHVYSECPHAKTHTDYKKPNLICKVKFFVIKNYSNRHCANCLGNHEVRNLGCSCP